MSVDVFDESVQAKILALMMTDRRFMMKCSEHVKPQYFDGDALVDLSRLSLDYFKKYKRVPTATAMIDMTTHLLENSKNKIPAEYFQLISDAYKYDVPERDYLLDKVVEFVVFQELRNALYLSADLLRTKEFAKIKKLVDRAFKIQQDSTPGIRFFDPEHIEERFNEVDGHKVPTGMPELDKCLGGGLGGGELGIILAPPNVGKSILLTILGCGAMKRAKKVAHFTLEMGGKKVANRYDRNLLKRGRQAIKDNKNKAKEDLIKWADDFMGDLRIKQWPTRSASILTIRAYLDQLAMEEDFIPDLILVDYSGIMKAVVPRDGRHQEIEENNELLRELAGELEIPIWTAAQTKSSAVNKAVITIEDLGESFAQSKVADVIVAACQTQKEYKEDKMRLILAKNRDDKKFQVLCYRTLFDVMALQYAPGDAQ